MSPIYLYECDKCDNRQERVQSYDSTAPVCCDEAMHKIPTAPSMIRIMEGSMTRVHSAGYKEGYAKEYRRSLEIDE